MADETDSGGEAAAADAQKTPSPQDMATPPPPKPTLAAYYGEPTPKVAEWAKAVRAAGGFTAADIEEVLQQLGARDPDLRKTLALTGAANPPPALRRWLVDVTRHLLADRLKGVSIDPQSPAHEQVGRIALGLAPGLRAKDRTARSASENLLRLAIRRVTDAKPDFSAGEMLALLFAPLREPEADTRIAPADLRGRVQEAGIAQLRDLSLVQAAALDRILGAERKLHVAVDRLATILGDVVAGQQRRRIGRLPVGGRLDIDRAHPVEEIAPRPAALDRHIAAQVVGGECRRRQRGRAGVDKEPPARDHQRAGHGRDQLAGDGDLALAERDAAIHRVAFLVDAAPRADQLVAGIGGGDQAGDVDVVPGGPPPERRGQVPGQAQRRIVGPADGAGARVEDGVGALDDGGDVGRAGGKGLGPQFQAGGDVGAALAAMRRGPFAAGLGDEVGIGRLPEAVTASVAM